VTSPGSRQHRGNEQESGDEGTVGELPPVRTALPLAILERLADLRNVVLDGLDALLVLASTNQIRRQRIDSPLDSVDGPAELAGRRIIGHITRRLLAPVGFNSPYTVLHCGPDATAGGLPLEQRQHSGEDGQTGGDPAVHVGWHGHAEHGQDAEHCDLQSLESGRLEVT
jgi:hypothetical protein